MNRYFDLFVTFARIPILEREVVDKKGYATSEELMDYYAVGQCTPGVIAVNTATFIGQKLAGTPGGVVATLGVVFPSLVIISVIAGILTNFADLPVVQNAFAGVRVCVCVLVFNAVVKLWKGAVADKGALALFLLICAASLFLDVTPVVYVVFAAVAGIILTKLGVRGK